MKNRILIVDDQAEIRKLVRLTLNKQYDLIEAQDGATAYEIVCQEQVDALILDVMMPGTLDGCEVCRMIKQDPSLPKPVIILLSARGQLLDQKKGLEVGADAYIVKPFSPLELVRVLEDLLNRKL